MKHYIVCETNKQTLDCMNIREITIISLNSLNRTKEEEK